MRHVLAALLIVFAVCQARAGSTPFSRDSAYANMKVLAGTIGPRPMGSPAEHRALEFAVAKFAAAGCQESMIMPFTTADHTNTTSGVAVGVLRGATGRIIVIGGHMDSSGPEVPGANDDGSGAACVMELARVLAQRPHQSTFVFCCWGGEEEGLCGSEFFVRNFPLIDSVSLMLQIDMADGAGLLEPDPDGPDQSSAPRWLVKAAYDVFYSELGYDGLRYPTQSATLNASTGGATGSDHQPFLAKGIPAIDFTSDVGYPIHTPQDNVAHFTPSGLDRSGDLVLKLAERFDGGVPSKGTESYLLLQLGTMPIFVDHTLLASGALLAFVLGIVTYLLLRRRQVPGTPRVRWSGLKLLLVTFVLQICAWYAETVLGVIRGYRFPWVNNFGGYVVLGILAAMLAGWFIVRRSDRVTLSADPAPYWLRAFLLLALFGAGLWLLSVELTVYPALAATFLVLALLCRPRWLKLLCFVLAVVPFVRLLFPEALGLLQRGFASSGVMGFWPRTLYNLGFVVLFTIASLPFVYGFAAVYRTGGANPAWFTAYGGRGTLIGIAVALAGVAAVLLMRPVYDDMWGRSVRLEQHYTMGRDSSTFRITGGEYLEGLRLTYDGRDTMITERTTLFLPRPARPVVVSWLTVSATQAEVAACEDSNRCIDRHLVLHSAFRPLSVEIRYASKASFQVRSPWTSGGRRRLVQDDDHHATFAWFSFPDTMLQVPALLSIRGGEPVVETIEVTYDSLSAPIGASRSLTNIFRRTIVTRTDTVRTVLPTENLTDALR
jgi:hypothetical protein